MEKLVILFFLFFFIILSYIRSEKILNPLSIMTSIWLGLLFLSSFSFTGIFIPTVYTQMVFISAVAAMNIGGFLAFSNKRRALNINLLNNMKYFIPLVIIFAMGPILWSLFSALRIVSNVGYPGYLAATRFSSGDMSLAFGGSNTLLSIILNISRPLLYASLFIGLSLFVLKKKKKIFILAVFCLMSLGFCFSSRMEILTIVLISLFTILLAFENKKIKNSQIYNKFKRIIYILIICFSVLIVTVSSFRTGGKMGLSELLLHYGVGYHTYGFTMFDIALNDPDSIIHNYNSFGLSTFSIL